MCVIDGVQGVRPTMGALLPIGTFYNAGASSSSSSRSTSSSLLRAVRQGVVLSSAAACMAKAGGAATVSGESGLAVGAGSAPTRDLSSSRPAAVAAAPPRGEVVVAPGFGAPSASSPRLVRLRRAAGVSHLGVAVASRGTTGFVVSADVHGGRRPMPDTGYLAGIAGPWMAAEGTGAARPTRSVGAAVDRAWPGEPACTSRDLAEGACREAGAARLTRSVGAAVDQARPKEPACTSRDLAGAQVEWRARRA